MPPTWRRNGDYYDKLQFDQAITLWEESEKRDDSFPTVHRNLAIAYYNKKKDPVRAQEEMERAYALDEADNRVFLELDQLYKKLEVPFEKRIQNYEKHPEVIEGRDDVRIEYITLQNLCGNYSKAYEAIMSHTFRPWEGAEGKITTQYKIALLEMAKECINVKAYGQAQDYLEKALRYPENLGEGRLEGTKDNHIYYYLGICSKAIGKEQEAQAYFERASLGDVEPAGVMYYYDQPADMILYQGLAKRELGKEKEARSRFFKLLDYGERHLNDEMRIEYFAVSLPDFLIFEDDLNRKNKAHCWYLMGLSYLGLGELRKAEESFDKALSYDANHQNARMYRKMTLK